MENQQTENEYPQLTQEEKDKFLNLNEVDTYFLIDECGAFMWRMNHSMARGLIDEDKHAEVQSDINKIREVQKFTVDNLGRFGVDPESAKDRENGDYWKWYHFWDNWKKGLSDPEWNTIYENMVEDKPFENLLPKGNWRDS